MNRKTIQLPANARGAWIENGNELNYYLVGETSADFESQKLPAGRWKIVSVSDLLIVVEKEKINI